MKSKANLDFLLTKYKFYGLFILFRPKVTCFYNNQEIEHALSPSTQFNQTLLLLTVLKICKANAYKSLWNSPRLT